MAGSDVVFGINMRGCSPAAFSMVAEEIGDGVVYEIDAHCRQVPMVEAGSGEYYLKNPVQLADVVKNLKKSDVTISVKIGQAWPATTAHWRRPYGKQGLIFSMST